MIHKRFPFGLAAALCFSVAVPAAGKTFYVAKNGSDSNPGTQAAPYANIEVGVYHAQAGDTVIVGPGTYQPLGYLKINFAGLAITLRSSDGPEKTTYDCKKAQRAIRFEAADTAVVDGFTFTNGVDADSGAGIYIAGGSPTIKNCIIQNGSITALSAPARGGAVYIGGGRPIFQGCTFRNNSLTNLNAGSAYAAGGAVYAGGGVASFVDCAFTGNAVAPDTGNGGPAWGGAVYVGPNASVGLTNCTVTNNSCRTLGAAEGGGVLCDGGSLGITGGSMSVNTAASEKDGASGGGVAARQSATISLDGVTLAGNRAAGSSTAAGGGISIHSAGAATLVRCELSNNISEGGQLSSSGGGIYSEGPLAVYHSTFRGNKAKGNSARNSGGGSYVAGSATHAIFRHCAYTGNAAESSKAGSYAQGGGAYAGGDAQATWEACNFLQNTATGIYPSGGGVCVDAGASATITNARIERNAAASATAGAGGGGVAVLNAQASLTNVLIAGNAATGGGASSRQATGGGLTVAGLAATATLLHTTVAGNGASAALASEARGGGIYVSQGTLNLVNSISWSNQSFVYATLNPALDMEGGVANVSWSDVEGRYPAAPDGDHNRGADPRFLRAPGEGPDGLLGTADDGAGDYRLLSTSPLLNQGNPAAAGLPPYDLEAHARVFGAAPDLGPFETGSTAFVSTQDRYVDRVNGSDTNPGTSAQPYKTVAAALGGVGVSALFPTLHVRAANYHERPEVRQWVRIVNWDGGLSRIGVP